MENKQFIMQVGKEMINDSKLRKEQLLYRLRDHFTNLMPYQRNEGRALKTLVSFTLANQSEEAYVKEKEKIVFQKDDKEYVFTMCEDVRMRLGELKHIYEVNKNGIVHDTLQNDDSYVLFKKQSNTEMIDQLIISMEDAFAYCTNIDIVLKVNSKMELILHNLLNEEKLACIIENGEKQYPVILKWEQEIHLLTKLDTDDETQDYKIILAFHDSYPSFYIQDMFIQVPKKNHTTKHLYKNEILVDDPAKLFDIPFNQGDCFYIGCSNAFTTKTELITVSFLIEMQVVEKNVSHEEIKYHWIMRHMPQEQIVYDVYAQQIVFEYFNGDKWIIIEELLSHQYLFMDENSRYVNLSFQAIPNWKPIEINECLQHYLRIRLIQSDHNYEESIRYHVPYMRDLKIIVSQHELAYTSIIRKNIIEENISDNVKTGYLMEQIIKQHSLYMGFQDGIPYSIYVQLQKANKLGSMNCSIYHNGSFQSINMIDESHAFSKSGRIILQDDIKYSQSLLFDQEAYWLRFDMLNECEECCIDKVYYHVGEAIEEREETLYFTLDEMNHEFAIPYTNINLIQVYVREKKEKWNEWSVVDYQMKLNKKTRNVYYDVDNKRIQFHPHVLHLFDIAHVENNVIAKIHSSEHLNNLPANSEGHLYIANDRVSSICSVDESYGFIALESDQQVRYHTSQLCSTFNRIICFDDLEKWIYTTYPSIQQCKLNFNYGVLTLIVVFKQEKQDCDIQILDEIRKQLLSFHYLKDMDIKVELPIEVKAKFEVKAIIVQKDVMKVKELIENLIERNLNLKIGEYPNISQCKQELVNAILNLQLLEFVVYLSYEKEGSSYIRKLEESEIYNNAMIRADKHDISIQRRTL